MKPNDVKGDKCIKCKYSTFLYRKPDELPDVDCATCTIDPPKVVRWDGPVCPCYREEWFD